MLGTGGSPKPALRSSILRFPASVVHRPIRHVSLRKQVMPPSGGAISFGSWAVDTGWKARADLPVMAKGVRVYGACLAVDSGAVAQLESAAACKAAAYGNWRFESSPLHPLEGVPMRDGTVDSFDVRIRPEWSGQDLAEVLVVYLVGYRAGVYKDEEQPTRWQLGEGNNVWLHQKEDGGFWVNFRNPWPAEDVAALAVLLRRLYRLEITPRP